MFKKILLSFTILGFLFGIPMLTNAASFTSLKNQLFELSQRIETFNLDLLGQAGGASTNHSITFTASSTYIAAGDTITLQFQAIGATSCTKSSSPGNSSWRGTNYPSGSGGIVGGSSFYVPVPQTTTFFVTCTYPGGATKTAQVIVNVVYILYLGASPVEIQAGGGTQLEWDISNATSCTKSSVPEHPQWNGSTFKSKKGVISVANITKTTKFYLTCTWPGGHVETTYATAVVLQDVSLKASPIHVLAGGETKLEWTIPVVPTCTKASSPEHPQWKYPQNFGLDSGVFTVSNITQTTTFSVKCTWSGGVVKIASATVTVSNVPEITFTSSLTKVSSGDKINLQFRAIGATSCTKASNPTNQLWTGIEYPSGSDGSVGGGSFYLPITQTTTFHVTCNYPGGTTKTSNITVSVLNKNELALEAPTSIPSGSSSSGINSCTFVFNKNLSYGSVDSKTSKDVSLLQAILVDEGFLSSKDATGKFYAITQSALIKFQKKYNLKQTGIADANTRVKLNELYKNYCAS